MPGQVIKGAGILKHKLSYMDSRGKNSQETRFVGFPGGFVFRQLPKRVKKREKVGNFMGVEERILKKHGFQWYLDLKREIQGKRGVLFE